ncbi:MAG: hypothetical protein SWQ30_08655 [Thermodesulfobacteriota bacterium]|nr:hypothetical protein [Thermodesulfobacteriota bacterium]
MKSLRVCSIFLALFTIIALSAAVIDAQYDRHGDHLSDCTVCRCLQTGKCRCHLQPEILIFPSDRLQHVGTIACKQWEKGGLKCAA